MYGHWGAKLVSRIFVSYTSSDAEVISKFLDACAKQTRLSRSDFWFAPTRIIPGEPFEDTIAGAIRAATRYLIFLSANTQGIDKRAYFSKEKQLIIRSIQLHPSKQLLVVRMSAGLQIPSDLQAFHSTYLPMDTSLWRKVAEEFASQFGD